MDNLRIMQENAEKITAEARLEAQRMLEDAKKECEALKSETYGDSCK